jgi:pyruvate dehydrogenase E2 component (dihydrolipoamide acetyltransferase)
MSESAPAAATEPGIKGEVTTIEPERYERTVARRSAEARATIPSVEYATVVEVEAALAQAGPAVGGLTPLLVRAVARALTRVPRVNGAYRDGRYELYSRVNVGVTYARDGLYLIPTLFDADRKSLAEIASELADLFARGRAGALAPAEVTGATFTLSDAGGLDVATLTPVIVPPQAAALAAGPVRAVPVVRDGQVVPGHTVSLTLACDHRIVYGSHAAQFLEEVRAHLEPEPS